MKKIIPAKRSMFTFLLISFLLSMTHAFSQGRWEKLGQRKVNFKSDRDEIGVGRFEGFFNGLQVKVKNGAINMQKMVVHFGNGETREIELRNNFTDGSVSRIIDLPGNVRMIAKVVFWYESTNADKKNKAIVELWGRH